MRLKRTSAADKRINREPTGSWSQFFSHFQESLDRGRYPPPFPLGLLRAGETGREERWANKWHACDSGQLCGMSKLKSVYKIDLTGCRASLPTHIYHGYNVSFVSRKWFVNTHTHTVAHNNDMGQFHRSCREHSTEKISIPVIFIIDNYYNYIIIIIIIIDFIIIVIFIIFHYYLWIVVVITVMNY